MESVDEKAVDEKAIDEKAIDEKAQIQEAKNNENVLARRKRINRMKIIIIAGLLLLFLLSMILNLVLIIKIYNIEKTLDNIYSYEESYVSQDLL